MKVRELAGLAAEGRRVSPVSGEFVSYRYLLERDGMGFTLTQTHIPKSDSWHFWHYRNHFEACLCISGRGRVKNARTGEIFEVEPNTMYALDEHDPHLFKVDEDTILVCVFNLPLKGHELHGKDGSYE